MGGKAGEAAVKVAKSTIESINSNNYGVGHEQIDDEKPGQGGGDWARSAQVPSWKSRWRGQFLAETGVGEVT